MSRTCRALVVLFLAVLCFAGCTKSSGDGDDGGGSGGGGDGGSDNFGFMSDCGVVIDGELKNPPPVSEGQEVSISRVVSSSLVIVQNGLTEQLIKLHGLGDNVYDFQKDAARSFLADYSTVYFYPAGNNCVAAISGGGAATVGQLFTWDGVSLSEPLLERKLASVDESDPCNPSLLTSCYNAVRAREQLPIADTRLFLWKPISESDGNLAVLVEPYNTAIVVNDELLASSIYPVDVFGGGGRGRRPGCAYGSNARVHIYDRATGGEYSVRGQKPFIVANTCQRLDLRD